MTEAPTFMTPAEVAKLLRVTPRTVQMLAVTGGLPAIRVGKRWRIDRALLHSQIASQLGERRPTAA